MKRRKQEKLLTSGPPRIVRTVLRCVEAFAAPIRWFGVDIPVLRAILEAKLTLDLRRSNIPGDQSSTPSFLNGGVIVTCLSYFLMGLLLGVVVFFVDDPFVYVTLVQAAVIFLVMMVLVIDFTNVLLDTADLTMIGPRPTDDRTALAARLIHIAIYLSLITGSIAIGPILFGSFVFAPLLFIPAFLAVTTLSAILAVGFVVGLYATVLRYVDTERFKGFVVYLQIGMTVLIFAGMQIGPRLFGESEAMSFVESNRAILLAVPPAHAGAFVAVIFGDLRPLTIVLGLLAWIVPFGALWIAVRVLSSGYLRGLQRLNVASDRAKRPETDERGAVERRKGSWLADRLCRSQIEKAGFDLTHALSRRERLFKLQAYSMLVFPILIMVMPLFTRQSVGLEFSVGLAILMVYIAAPNMLLQLRYSENWNASWLFKALPIDLIGDFLAGMVKSILFTLLVPYWILLLVIAALIAGIDVLPSALLAVSIAFVMFLATALRLGNILPFAKKFSVADASGRTGIFVIVFMTGMLGAGAHVALNSHPISRVAGMVGGTIVSWLLVRRLYTLRVVHQ